MDGPAAVPLASSSYRDVDRLGRSIFGVETTRTRVVLPRLQCLDANLNESKL